MATTIIALKKPNSNTNSVLYSYSHRYHNGSVWSREVSGVMMPAVSESPSEQQRRRRPPAGYKLSMKRPAAALQEGIVFEMRLVLWWTWLEEGGEGLQVCKVQSFHVCVGGFSAQQKEKKIWQGIPLFWFVSWVKRWSTDASADSAPVKCHQCVRIHPKPGSSAANSVPVVHFEDCHRFARPRLPLPLLHWPGTLLEASEAPRSQLLPPSAQPQWTVVDPWAYSSGQSLKDLGRSIKTQRWWLLHSSALILNTFIKVR